jgi:PDZ domain-containing protein
VRVLPSPTRLLLAGALLLVVVVVALLEIQSGDYLLVPDPAHSAAPPVHVQGGHEPRGPGGIYYVDVIEQPANWLEKLIPPLRPSGSSLVQRQQVIPPGADYQAAQRLDREMMQSSQRLAAAVALRSLGYKVTTQPRGVQVDGVVPESGAEGKILPGDRIVAASGIKTLTVQKLVSTVRSRRVGERIRIRLIRGEAEQTVTVRLMRASPGTSIPAIGLFPIEQAANVVLPISVRIDTGNVGGPSAGLAFALEVLAELGHDPTRGYRVAATGQINLDGTISPIGGVKQKTYGVRRAHADVFLVPAAGDNARDAKRYADGLKIIPVRSFQQALHALAKLPPKR